MRKIVSFLLVFALMLSTVTSAFAADDTEVGEQPQESENQTTVTVSTLEDLQAAVSAADDGDTIAISKCIKLKNVSLVTDKDITLVPSDNSVGVLIEMSKGSQLSGFTLFTNACAVLISNYEGGEVTIANCVFVGNENYYNFLVNITGGTVQISDSDFQYGKDITLNISASCAVTVEGCSFIGNAIPLVWAAAYITVEQWKLSDVLILEIKALILLDKTLFRKAHSALTTIRRTAQDIMRKAQARKYHCHLLIVPTLPS